LIGVEDLTGSGLRVLRHAEIERELRYGIDYPMMIFGDDRYTYIRERRVLTDEASGDSTVADVESCSPPVFADPLGPPSSSSTAPSSTMVSVDSYLNPLLRCRRCAPPRRGAVQDLGDQLPGVDAEGELVPPPRHRCPGL
jgi:hypothetical protein